MGTIEAGRDGDANDAGDADDNDAGDADDDDDVDNGWGVEASAPPSPSPLQSSSPPAGW
jgi:hypothetical protein